MALTSEVILKVNLVSVSLTLPLLPSLLLARLSLSQSLSASYGPGRFRPCFK